MKKFKELFDKFKGIVLAVALGVLTFVEGYGGYINELCGGTLSFKGVDVIPLVTGVASLIVGIISNKWTKEQNKQIKAFLKSSELLVSESKKNETIANEKKQELKDL